MQVGELDAFTRVLRIYAHSFPFRFLSFSHLLLILVEVQPTPKQHCLVPCIAGQSANAVYSIHEAEATTTQTTTNNSYTRTNPLVLDVERDPFLHLHNYSQSHTTLTSLDPFSLQSHTTLTTCPRTSPSP